MQRAVVEFGCEVPAVSVATCRTFDQHDLERVVKLRVVAGCVHGDAVPSDNRSGAALHGGFAVIDRIHRAKAVIAVGVIVSVSEISLCGILHDEL